MLSAFALTDDLDLDVQNGQGPREVSGADRLKSAVLARMSTQAGQWRYDLTYGPDYNNDVLGRFFDEDTSRAILTEELSRTRGIAPVPVSSVTTQLDNDSRIASYRFDPVFTFDGDETSTEITTQ